MIPTLNEPTRITTNTATAIDHTITDSLFENDFKSAIAKTDILGHFPVIFTIKLKGIEIGKD